MQHDPSPSLFAADQRPLWRASETAIWSLANDHREESPIKSIMRSLWDQPRWLEAYHLYDERGSHLFEQICELSEYYLTRTEEAILERDAANIIALAPVNCIVELGAGSAKKTNHLLKAQIRQRGSGIFAPIDVSVAGLIASRNFVRQNFPRIDFQGLHARYEEALSSIDQKLPTLFVFLGSTVGNFNPPAFVRFFSLLSHAMGPNDFLLLGADRVKDIGVLEAAYDDPRGLTAEFILNVFKNINRMVASNFDLGKMRYHSRYNPEWQQVEMYAVSTETQQIEFPSFRSSFCWEKGDRILVEISRKFYPERLQDQFRFFDLVPVKHFTDPKEWFSLLLFRKAS
jgi:L-histidine N-alpha-methyltransferase